MIIISCYTIHTLGCGESIKFCLLQVKLPGVVLMTGGWEGRISRIDVSLPHIPSNPRMMRCLQTCTVSAEQWVCRVDLQQQQGGAAGKDPLTRKGFMRAFPCCLSFSFPWSMPSIVTTCRSIACSELAVHISIHLVVRRKSTQASKHILCKPR